MNRVDNWGSELSDFLTENNDRSFKRGSFDCAIFAGLALQVVTGENFVDDWLNKFTTKKEAYKLLKSQGFDDLLQLVTSYMGSPLPSINHAGRGDIVAIEYKGIIGLGVIDMTGRRAVTPGLDGLVFLDSAYWLEVWRV